MCVDLQRVTGTSSCYLHHHHHLLILLCEMILSFHLLQFMDFWLSFMAVIVTFVYLSTADESVKRTIHTVVAILTALLALTKATRCVS